MQNCNIVIERGDALPPEFEEEMLPAALQENFVALRWLRDDWQSGANTFSAPGEAFYVARCDGRLVGVGGVNQDPYAGEAAVGRLRRMYVLPSFRRMGIGRRLVQRVVEDARKHFHTLRLRTLDAGASAFYEALGFETARGTESATHEMVIGNP